MKEDDEQQQVIGTRTNFNISSHLQNTADQMGECVGLDCHSVLHSTQWGQLARAEKNISKKKKRYKNNYTAALAQGQWPEKAHDGKDGEQQIATSYGKKISQDAFLCTSKQCCDQGRDDNLFQCDSKVRVCLSVWGGWVGKHVVELVSVKTSHNGEMVALSAAPVSLVC